MKVKLTQHGKFRTKFIDNVYSADVVDNEIRLYTSHEKEAERYSLEEWTPVLYDREDERPPQQCFHCMGKMVHTGDEELPDFEIALASRFECATCGAEAYFILRGVV